MTWSDASDYLNVMKGQQDVLSGPGMFTDKARLLSGMDAALNKSDPKPRQVTLGDILHGAIGAAVGIGLAKGVSAVLPINDSFKDKLQMAGAGLGALMNTGVVKLSEDEQIKKEMDMMDKIAEAAYRDRGNAFRLGFLKAAHELGIFRQGRKDMVKKAVAVLNVSPADLFAIPGVIGKGVSLGGRILGSGASAAVLPDEDDEELAKIQVQKAMLEEKINEMDSVNKSRRLKKLLARRKSRA